MTWWGFTARRRGQGAADVVAINAASAEDALARFEARWGKPESVGTVSRIDIDALRFCNLILSWEGP